MFFLKTAVFLKCSLSKYAVVGCKVCGYVWVHVYAFWVHVYGSVGCMYAVVGCKSAVVGCKSAETFGCMYAAVGCKFHTAESLPDSR
jgi:hypothetical protein